MMRITMPSQSPQRRINLAIAGLGNCAASLIEGLAWYRQHPDDDAGLLFSVLAGYTVRDINVVVAFDVAKGKVGVPVRQAIYQAPNNFVRIEQAQVDCMAPVLRGPTLDGHPAHLARFVDEVADEPIDVAAALRDHHADVLINLLPTGSVE